MALKFKNLLLITYILLFTNTIYSQTNFEKGTFTTNTDEKVECLIKSIDWKNNPTEFKYKLTENGDIKTETIETVKAFEIYNFSKYIRAIVDIDRSTNNVNSLTSNKNPKFKEEQLFLKLLVESNANLYYYEDGNLKRFFYNLEEEKIEQLVFKEYLFDADKIGQNNQFRQQLLNSLKCEDISINNIRNLAYKIKALSNIFEKYNNCIGGEEVVSYQKNNKKDLLSFRAKVGFGSASLSIKNAASSNRDADFDTEFIYRFGGELEMLLPFNNNKWALVVEPSYQSYTSEKYIANSGTSSLQNRTKVEADYSTIEIPFGLRYYFFLNDNSKIFVNVFYSLIFTNKSSIVFNDVLKLEIEKSSGKSIGIGYNYKKLSLEGRYELSRDILGTYRYYHSEYNQVSLIFGYQIF